MVAEQAHLFHISLSLNLDPEKSGSSAGYYSVAPSPLPFYPPSYQQDERNLLGKVSATVKVGRGLHRARFTEAFRVNKVALLSDTFASSFNLAAYPFQFSLYPRARNSNLVEKRAITNSFYVLRSNSIRIRFYDIRLEPNRF